jgi:hypothetical protein
MENNAPAKFKLINADVLEYTYFNPVNFKPKIDPEQEFEVKFKIDYRWDVEKNQFAVVVSLLYLMETEKNKKYTVLKTSIITHYEVEELHKHFDVRSNNDFDMNIPLETSLVSIAISTSRGILIEKTNGTLLRNIILPVVQPTDFILSPKMNGEKTDKSEKVKLD